MASQRLTQTRRPDRIRLSTYNTMSAIIHSFIHLLFIGIIALFPVVNPIGSAFIVNPYFERLSAADRKIAVRKITLYAFCVCTVALFAGHYILELFGISIPVIQLGGGIMICKMGWEFLSADDAAPRPAAASEGASVTASDYGSIEPKLFYPITFPVTTGAGTVSVLFTLSAHSANEDFSTYMLNTTAILLSILFMCALVYIFYMHTKKMITRLGSSGEKITNRITAFLIFCVGLQISVSGIQALMKT
ncbi:MarC family protein [Herbaspirillum rhizosphaerae]|uniref:MarC family protein n=1 Tax=Herbaspirillum rhizosphaerae TaxID=346179 RepID=UPI000A85042E|nr:MarC family protein [Herbaspirillum rhizosphaerae]